MPLSSPSLVYRVRRCPPELVAPSMPTPHELKLLSDIDDQDGLRFQIPVIQFYSHQPSLKGKDPVQVIRQALAKALVFYYPFAGRLREGPNRKLMVDCTGEGVMFIEADADATLKQFGDDLQPPFPGFQELLYDVPGTEEIINTPLLLIQVTRLICGGFIFAIRVNHTMSDAAGAVQFMNAVAEIARGAEEPSLPPVWGRELLSARDPPHVTRNHLEYQQILPDIYINAQSEGDLVQQSFFFGPSKIAAIRRLVPHHFGPCSTFEVLTAYTWRCRIKALQLKPHEEIRIMCLVNARARFNPPLPVGYYGNGFAYPAAVTTAGKLCGNPLEYAVELIQKAKAEVTQEYMQSVADFMVTNGRPVFTMVRSCLVSDLTHAGLREVDFGWGKALYGGVAKAGAEACPAVNFHVPYKNAKGEEGIVVLVCLPDKVMKRFGTELDDNDMLECRKNVILRSGM